MSNKKQYGPYGVKEGKYFSTLSTSGKIVGFLGRIGWLLESIGASFVSHNLISIGPFGGYSGDKFDDGTYKKIRQINLRHDDTLYSIRIAYEDNIGHIHVSNIHGIKEGGILVAVIIDDPDEYLKSISGYYEGKDGDLIIQSIKFHSNKQDYGPYGEEDGEYFSTSTKMGKLIGFFGSSDLYINLIGAHFDPIP